MSIMKQLEPPLHPPFLAGSLSAHHAPYLNPKAPAMPSGKWVKPETTTRLATHRLAVINKQLHEGQCEVNVGAMSPSDFMAFVERLAGHARRVSSLKLIVMPRGIGFSQYTLDAEQDPRAVRGKILLSEWHQDGVNLASATVQNKKCRNIFYTALLNILLTSDIVELDIGMRLTSAGYRTLSSALARNVTLRKLSFRGSHMKDGLLALLKPGLEANNSLEELDLTACSLSDRSATLLASIIKSHTERRIVLGFHDHLRNYPDLSLAPCDSEFRYRRELQQLAKGVDEQCGGLVHLEIGENLITDRGVSDLCASLSFDRRLAMLGLRSNKVTRASEEIIIELMKDHRALARVDLRQNGSKKDNLGILKLAKPSLSRPFFSALGYKRDRKPLVSPSRTQTSLSLEQLDAPPSLSSPPRQPRGRAEDRDQDEPPENPLHVTLSLTAAAESEQDATDNDEKTDREAPPFLLALLSSVQANEGVFDDEEGRREIVHLQSVAQQTSLASIGGDKRKKKKVVRRKSKATKSKKSSPEDSNNNSLIMIQEIAAIFRELEIKVSSLELLHELKRGEPRQKALPTQAISVPADATVARSPSQSPLMIKSLEVSSLKDQLDKWTRLIDDALIEQDP